jgi:putative FmdB family regulatory protein
MPIYEYRCGSCGYQSEYLQKVSDPILSVCPQCGKDAFKKLLTAAGFQLKGSGWYATDFKGSTSQPKKEESDAKSDDGKQSESSHACGAGSCPACS